MVKPSSHCPHLGLKQNRAIRFASPTSEHRCYVTGEAQDIPVDQASYCLCPEHVNCPLYMGLSMSSTPSGLSADHADKPGGVRRWLALLSMRDKLIYGALLSMMLFILGIYIVLAVQLLLDTNPANNEVEAYPASASPTATPSIPATDTVPTLSPAAVVPPVENETVVPTAEPTLPPEQEATAAQPPESTPTLAAESATTQAEVLLYFAEPTGTLLVPAARQVSVASDAPEQLATAALSELIAGPLPGSGLNGAVASNVGLREEPVLSPTGILTINLDRSPGDDMALKAIALTLTELQAVESVQIQVDGQDVGLAGDNERIGRLPYNIHNPAGLPESFGSRETSFLSLYFPSSNVQGHYTRISRLVPRTTSPARKTVEELLAGPGPFGNLLTSPIPADTQLNDIRFDDNDDQFLIVDLSQPFADAINREAALDTLLLSLTDLRNAEQEPIEKVQVLIDGRELSEAWGSEFAQPFFTRPALNAESGGNGQ